MTALLDVNVLVALFDPAHMHHDRAHGWFGAHRSEGWATCPLTENGFLRVVSNPAYPGRVTPVADAMARLRRLTGSEDHVFWPADLSALDPKIVDPGHLGGHRQITDAYLLALAVAREGTVVTFDGSLPVDAVVGAASETVVTL